MAMAYKWSKWLKTEYNVAPLNAVEDYYVPTHVWIKSLVVDGIAPILTKANYVFKYPIDITVNKYMNFIYQLDHGRQRRYKNMCTNDDQEYFHSFKCTVETWKKLKRDFYIEYLADDSEFAEKLWFELPYFIFEMLNIPKSNATEELNELLEWEDEEDSDGEKKSIDPYLIDHGRY